MTISRLFKLIRAVPRDLYFRLHGLRHDTITTQTKQGLLTMSTRCWGIGAPLYRHRQFEYDASVRVVKFLYDQELLPSDNVHMLDVGANIGMIGIGLKLAGLVDTVTAVEPEDENFCLLQTNVNQNGLYDSIRCVWGAVGATHGALVLEKSGDNHGDHRIRTVYAAGREQYGESKRKTVRVPCYTLDEICTDKQPSLLWLDIQGYEGYAFCGGKEMLKRRQVPAVSEVWPYGILRAGMTLDAFAEIVASIWGRFYIERGSGYEMRSTYNLDAYLRKLHKENRHENVIFAA